MARLTLRQTMNRRELLEDDAKGGVERFAIDRSDLAAMDLTDSWVRSLLAGAVIKAIERNHTISEKRRR